MWRPNHCRNFYFQWHRQLGITGQNKRTSLAQMSSLHMEFMCPSQLMFLLFSMEVLMAVFANPGIHTARKNILCALGSPWPTWCSVKNLAQSGTPTLYRVCVRYGCTLSHRLWGRYTGALRGSTPIHHPNPQYVPKSDFIWVMVVSFALCSD